MYDPLSKEQNLYQNFSPKKEKKEERIKKVSEWCNASYKPWEKNQIKYDLGYH